MPTIKLVDAASLEIASLPSTPTLAHYLQGGLVFSLAATKPEFKQALKNNVSAVDAGAFPVSLPLSIPGSFAVSSATLNLKAGAAASIDVLSGDKADDFAKSLGPGAPSSPFLVSFSLTGQLDSGPSGTVGDFCVGLYSGREITVTNTCPVAGGDPLPNAIQQAMSGLTFPHGLDDLRALPPANVCSVEGKASLKFTASVQYSLLNNTLATAPFQLLSQSLSLKDSSGVQFTVSVENSTTHQITVAALGGGKLRLSVSLADEADTEEAFDFSIGATGNIGTTDALQFLIQHFSNVPDKDLAQIRAFLGAGEQSDLGAQIKTVVQNATKSGITASLHDAFKQSKENKYLFIYDVDLNALDGSSATALQSALRGDFTLLTAPTSVLSGITEIKSISTLTLTQTHTLTLHLLGILNFSNVSSFMKKAKMALVGDTNELVLAATDIKIVQNTINPDHLRKVLTKSAMITSAADSSPLNPDFKYQMAFFMKKANPGKSDLRQFANSLAFIASPDAATAAALCAGPAPADIFIDLTLKLDKTLSTSIFKSSDGSRFKTADDFVVAGQKTMGAILANDPDSANRMPLFSVGLDFWKQLREAGAAPNVQSLLATRGMTTIASWTDFVTIDWWSQAMGKMAAELGSGSSLMDAEAEVLKDSEAGFDLPWAILATDSLLGRPSHIVAKFAASGLQQTAAAGA